MKSKKILSFLFYTTLALCLVSCGKDDIEQPPPENTEQIGEIEQTQIDTPVIKEEIIFKNKLTGLPIDESLENQRPIAVMFNNIKPALPQVGISSFDILYEITTEGAITRLMGVVTDWKSLSAIGSVRSSRDYFIDISDAHNAIYVHAGGSTYAYNELWKRGTERIDGTNGTYADQTAFYRDKERMKTMALEHTLVTNGKNLSEAIEKNKFSTVYKERHKTPLSFSEEEHELNGDIANYIYIPFSYYAQGYLCYDEDTKVYSKGQHLGVRNSLDLVDSPHIDSLTGEAITFKNVIVLYAEHSGPLDDKGRISVTFVGNGDGYYMTNGKCVPITWKKITRNSTYTLYDSDGYELLLNPGKTYIAIVPMNCDLIYK